MKLLMRSLLLFVVIALLSCWIALQTDRGQAWSAKTIAEALQDETGYNVTVGTVSGLFPLYLQVDDVTCYKSVDDNELTFEKKVLSAGRTTLVPNWFGILLGKSSFLYIDLDRVDLCHFFDHASSQTPLPTTSIHIWSLHASHVTLPKQYTNFLLNSLHQDVAVDIFCNVHGSLHYKAAEHIANASLKVQPVAEDCSPLTIALDVAIDPKKTAGCITLDAQKVASGAVFVSLPIDRLQLEATLTGNTETLMTAPCFSGTWKLSGVDREDTKSGFPASFHFLVTGTVDAPTLSSLSLTTTDIRCHKLLAYIPKSHAIDDEDIAIQPQLVDVPLKASLQASCKLGTEMSLSFDHSFICYDGHTIEPLSASLVMTPQQQGVQGRFSLAGIASSSKLQKPLNLQASATFATDMRSLISFSDIDIAMGGFPIKGNLDFSLYPLQCQGELKSSSKNISELLSAFHIAKMGSGSFLCTFTRDELLQKMRLQLGVSDLKSDTYSLETLSVDAIGSGSFCAPDVDIAARATHLATKTTTVETAILTSTLFLDGSKPSPFAITVNGESKSMQFASKLAGSCTRHACSIDTLGLQLGSALLHAPSPIQVLFANETFTALPFSLQQGDKTVFTCASASTKDTTTTQITLDAFPLEILDPFLPIYLFGNASGQMELFGRRTAPKLYLCLSSSNLTFWPPSLYSYEPLMGSVELEHIDDMCSLHAEVQGLSMKKPLEVRLRLPGSLSTAPVSFCPSLQEQVQAKITGDVDITSFFSPYLEEDEAIGGRVGIDAYLCGTLEKPNCSGFCSWHQGNLHIPVIGSQLQDIEAKLVLNGVHAKLTKFQGLDDKGGAFAAEGSASLIPTKGVQYDLTGTLDNFEIINTDSSLVTANGKVQLAGGIDDASLVGTLDVTGAKLSLSPNITSDIPKLEITYVNLPKEEKQFTATPFSIRYDLDISLPQKGIIDGMGLDSEWKGKVHLTGKNSDMQLQGGMQLVSGSFTFATKNFALTRGSVDFRGDLMTKSNLNVLASQDFGSVAVEIALKGPLQAPKVLLQSNPQMKEKEILSWILFNKSASEISPMEGLQLAQALLKLRGSASGLDIVDKLKETLGLDRIDFGSKTSVAPSAATSADPNATVPNEVSFQLGKYISDGVIVTVSKDVTNEVNRVGIEADLTKHITAEAYVGDDAETELSLRWKYRY